MDWRTVLFGCFGCGSTKLKEACPVEAGLTKTMPLVVDSDVQAVVQAPEPEMKKAIPVQRLKEDSSASCPAFQGAQNTPPTVNPLSKSISGCLPPESSTLPASIATKEDSSAIEVSFQLTQDFLVVADEAVDKIASMTSSNCPPSVPRVRFSLDHSNSMLIESENASRMTRVLHQAYRSSPGRPCLKRPGHQGLAESDTRPAVPRLTTQDMIACYINAREALTAYGGGRNIPLGRYTEPQRLAYDKTPTVYSQVNPPFKPNE